ncbi:MAG: HNH endonuclease signature motif containing protein [Patescibacteria group bacterium]|nr:HNH endonuclease signature motif containing protein [Patescibacteria group bacterium]
MTTLETLTLMAFIWFFWELLSFPEAKSRKKRKSFNIDAFKPAPKVLAIKNEKETIEALKPTVKALTTDKEKKTYIDAKGYLRFKDSDILVHRYVASKHLGRRLGFDEVVHHRDGNKRNNRPDNLYVCNQAEHQAIHFYNLRVHGDWYGE